MQATTIGSNPRRWIAVAIIIVAGGLTLAVASLDISGSPSPSGEVVEVPSVIVTGLTNGPVPGMPKSTFDALTRSVSGESGGFVVPTLSDGPVPGMPRGTFENLTSTAATEGQPVGMPNYVWEAISE